MENNNPLSPHLQIYKWQISSLLSITHRIVGVINFFAIILICAWAIFIIFGQNNYSAVNFFLNTSFIEKNRNVSLIIFSVVLPLLILEFFTITFPDHKIDSFHDGQKLSSAYKSYLDGSLWSGSFVTVGIFFETLS